MGIVFRQSVKTTIVIFLGALSGAVVNWGYANALTAQTHGYTRNLLNQGSLFQFSIILGTAGTLMTFMPRFELKPQKHVLITIAAIVPFISSLLLLIPYAVFKEAIISIYKPADQALVRRYYYWLPVLTLLWGYMTQVEYYLSTQHKSAVSNFIREVVLKLFNLGVIALFYYRFISFDAFIGASVIIYAIPVILMVGVARTTKDFGFSLSAGIFSKQQYKELAIFSWYHLLEGVSSIIMVLLDSYLLGILSVNGLTSVSVYAIAIFIVTLMTAPYRAMVFAAFPVLNLTYAQQDWEKLRTLFQRSAINTLIVAVIMAASIMVNLHNALFFLKPEYAPIIKLVPIMTIGRLVDMGTGLNREVISISEYYKQNFRLAVLLVFLLLACNIYLIPKYDIYGAAWGTTISIVLFNIGKALFLYKKLKLQPFTINTLYVLLAGLISGTAGYLLPCAANPFIDIMIHAVVVFTLYLALLLWLKPSEDLTAYLRSVRENRRLF